MQGVSAQPENEELREMVDRQRQRLSLYSEALVDLGFDGEDLLGLETEEKPPAPHGGRLSLSRYVAMAGSSWLATSGMIALSEHPRHIFLIRNTFRFITSL